MINYFIKEKNSEYREDIQGIRAVGAILIMIYHIWLNKVSGGVDVFFVISGFLMTGILVKQYNEKGRILPVLFWAKIIKRLAPSAYLVLLATLIGSYFFYPVPLWPSLLSEVIASALHVENIQLIRKSVDYLAREVPPSPVQQFWALSIQIQFYIFLPFVIAVGFHISKKLKKYKSYFFNNSGRPYCFIILFSQHDRFFPFFCIF